MILLGLLAVYAGVDATLFWVLYWIIFPIKAFYTAYITINLIQDLQ